MAKNNKDLLQDIDPNNLPNHVAIIMDGNGRWASKRLLPRTLGHRAGMSSLKEIVRVSSNIGIKNLTVFAFSTENWKRPKNEVNYLMNLLVEFLHKEIEELHSNEVRIRILGNYDVLPVECVDLINDSTKKTNSNQGLCLNIALNYGARLEILSSVKAIAEMVSKGQMSIDEITEESFSDMLYTQGIPDPDLVIRTAGEMRISNFLLWQIAYSEIWISKRLWPDFNRDEFLLAIIDYQKRDRRYGGLSK